MSQHFSHHRSEWAKLAQPQSAGGLVSALDAWAQVLPERTAFVADWEVWTYQRLAAESERLARALLARGVQAGDRVALHMANRPELAVAYYACFRLGALAAPLNTRLKTAELRPLLRRLRPALYLGQATLYPHVALVEPGIVPVNARFVVGGAIADGPARPWASLTEGAAERSLPHNPSLDAPAVLIATSGTTGQPKFVVHTQATLSTIAASFAQFGLGGEQVALLAAPMMHASGLFTLLNCVHFGASAALLERFDPDTTLDAIEAHRCSWILGLPFMFAELLLRQREHPRAVGSLRHCLCVGDVCPPALQVDFAAVFGVPLRSFLGSTEAGASLTYGLQPGPVSRIPPGTQVRVVDDAGTPVPRGTVGELLIHSSQVSPGYWAGPGRIEGVPEGGWLRTGDLVRQGDGNDLWFAARKKDLIVRGGSNIAPAEVEQALLAHPAVRDAAVFGVPDPVLGQHVAALVQLAAGTGDASAVLDGIRADTMARLADYKVPEWLYAVGAIPRNAAGKVDHAALLAMVPGLAAREPIVAQ